MRLRLRVLRARHAGSQTRGRLAGYSYSSACGQMASSANSPKKMASCIGNATGTLKGKPFSVITYNAGLHDCDAPEQYANGEIVGYEGKESLWNTAVVQA